jgi:hypothetical protein
MSDELKTNSAYMGDIANKSQRFMGLNIQLSIDVPKTSHTHKRNKYSTVKVAVVIISTAFHTEAGVFEKTGSVSKTKQTRLRSIIDKITDAAILETIRVVALATASGSSKTQYRNFLVLLIRTE